ncbi:Alpha/beta hydrolase family [Actinoalloteichus sp. GBA129-24]|uniref:Alpha/beta hydrolase family n=1 Tax=Actinoalloteichus fjordicus TaxID=1612552 RepID=A0AAC9L9H3_9PSEU|nr:Alpha/beta hydrolase family [Actinoalloteichus fjordicus]APU18206.1 Alpha/beta hydrolase family [Actinoalloteichus sp. GBA129-24]
MLLPALLAGTAVLAPVAAAETSLAGDPGQPTDPIRLTLPAPTGDSDIGSMELHVVDETRNDPWVPEVPYRELMVSVWYPTKVAGSDTAPWMPPNSAEKLLADVEERTGLPMDQVRLPETRGQLGVAVDEVPGGRPVVLYSPGSGMPRAVGTSVVQELASHGYVVVTVDHTYNARHVEFPGGRVVSAIDLGDDFGVQASVHAEDLSFVVDVLTEIVEDGASDAVRGRLPDGLGAALDLADIGVLGHSLGGSAAAAALHGDARFDAAMSLDGPVFSPVVEEGFDEPFLLFTQRTYEVPSWWESWDAVWPRLRGNAWQLDLVDASHNSYTDYQFLYPQIEDAFGLPPGGFVQQIGTIDPADSFDAQRAYARAFFDQELRGIPDGLLNGPSPLYPQVEFLR